MGLSLGIAFVGHVIWLRFGWEDVPLRCFDNHDWSGWQELTGELQPQAADTLERVLRALYGDAAVKRSEGGRVRVRPAVAFFDDNGRLRDLTTLLSYRFAVARGNVAGDAEWVSDCRLTQYELFAGGRARYCWDPWETHVIGVIEQESWPLLSRAFEMHVPEPGAIEEIAARMSLTPTESRPRLANQKIPDEIACGFTFDDRVMFFELIAGGLIASPLYLLRSL